MSSAAVVVGALRVKDGFIFYLKFLELIKAYKTEFVSFFSFSLNSIINMKFSILSAI